MQSLAAKPSHDQEQDFLQQLKQEGIRDDELGSFLDKLGGAIAPKQVSTMDLKVPCLRSIAMGGRQQMCSSPRWTQS